MNENYPPIPPEYANFARWLETPEPCCRFYPSVCDGSAISSMKLGGKWYSLCKGCMRTMREQVNNVIDELPSKN